MVRVQRGQNPEDSWEVGVSLSMHTYLMCRDYYIVSFVQVSHRYNNFYALYQTLQVSISLACTFNDGDWRRVVDSGEEWRGGWGGGGEWRGGGEEWRKMCVHW